MESEVIFCATEKTLSISDIFSIIESVTTLLALIASILIFWATIKDANKERRLNTSKEILYLFLTKVDKFFKKTDPQDYYDCFSIIYNTETTSFNEVYAKLKRIEGKKRYISQEILLYLPETGGISEIIISLIGSLEKESNYIIDIMCFDAEKRERKKEREINYARVSSMLDEYNEYYSKVVSFVFKGLHIMQDVNFMEKEKNEKIESYKQEYKDKFKNEI